MPFIDLEASKKVREMREARGLSPEALADAIQAMVKAKGDSWSRGAVDAFTIRRVEGNENRPGFVPTIRVQFVLATFFEVDRRDIWRPGLSVRVPSESKKVIA